MEIRSEDLDKAVTERVITADQRQRILDLAAARIAQSGDTRFDATHLAWFVGCVMLAVAALQFLSGFDKGARVPIAIAYLFAASFAAQRAANRGDRFLGSLLSLIAALCAPLLGWTLTEYFNLNDRRDIFVVVGSLCVAVGAWELWRHRFPAATLVLWLGVALLVFVFLRIPEDEKLEQLFTLQLGWATLLVAYLANMLARRINYTFWLNKVGLLALATGMFYYTDKVGGDVEFRIEFLWTSLAVLIAAAILRYPSYTFTGVVGVVTYVNYLAFEVFDKHLRIFAVVIAVQALLLIVASSFFYARREMIGGALDRHVPKWIQSLRPKPPPDPWFGNTPDPS